MAGLNAGVWFERKLDGSIGGFNGVVPGAIIGGIKGGWLVRHSKQISLDILKVIQ